MDTFRSLPTTHSSALLITAVVVWLCTLVNWMAARMARRAEQRDTRRVAAIKVIKTRQLVTGSFGDPAIMAAWAKSHWRCPARPRWIPLTPIKAIATIG